MIGSTLWRAALLALCSAPLWAQPVASSVTPSSDISGPSHASVPITIQGAGFCSGSQAFLVIQGVGNLLPGSAPSTTQINATIPGSLLTSPDPNAFVYVGNGNSCQIGGASNSLAFPVAAPALVITNPNLPNATQGQPYSTQIQASGGVSPYSLSASPSQLPPGLTLSSSGVLSGTPTVANVFTFPVTIFDSAGNQSTPMNVTLRVNSASVPPVLSSLSPTQTTAGASGFTLTITGSPICSGATLFFGTSSLPLTIVNSGQAQATIPANLIVNAGTRQVTYQNSSNPVGQGGCGTTGVSNALPFTINQAPVLAPATLPSGQINVPYSQTFSATLGTPPYFFSLAGGNLPAGLNFNSSAGSISGTPTVAGTSVFQVQVTDASGVSTARSYSLQINSNFAVTSVSPSVVQAGSPDLPIVITGAGFCTGSIVRFDGTQIPFTLGSSGITSGPTTLLATVPTALLQTARNTTVAVDNGQCPAGGSGSLPFSVIPAILISPATLPTAVQGTPYSQAITATGGTPPLSLTLSGLPPGLRFVNGAITGTPTAAGSYSVVATALDANVPAQSKSVTYTLLVAPPFALTSVTPSSVVAGSPDLPIALSGSGFCAATVVQFDGTALATSQSLVAGILTATVPSALLQTPHTATIAVDNTRCPSGGSGALAFTILAPLQISPGTLPTAVVGVNYSQAISASGGTPPYTISVTSSQPNLSFVNGVLSGVPATPGLFTVVATVTDSGNPAQTKTVTYSLTVISPVSFITTTLSDAFQNNAYFAQLLVKGGTPPYTFSLVNPAALPRGLTLSSSGLITGTPTVVGTYTFTVQVADSQAIQPSPLPTQTFTLRVVSTTPQLQITNTALPNGRVGQAYAFALSALGGDGNYTWALLNPQPDLQVNAAGFLIGTPLTAGTRQLTIQVTDGKGATAQATLPITIDAALLSIPSAPTTTLVVGANYSQAIVVNGGAGPFQISILNGLVPPGVTLTGSTLSGAVTTPDTFTFTVQAVDAAKNVATQTYTVVVVPVLTILTTSLNAPSPGVAYTQTIQVSGGTPPYTFTLSKGALPSGLNLSSGGVISGTPTGSGTFNFTVQVADSGTQVKTQDYTLTLSGGLIISTASPLPGGMVGQQYNQTLAAAGGVGTVQFVVTSGSLPAGLNLSSGGQITGQPTAAGTSTFTVQATDSTKATATKTFTITVVGSLSITPITLPAGLVGTLYTQSIIASGGTGQILFSIASGSLPAGIQLSPDGTLTGRPTANGTFSFTVQATDAAQNTATLPLTLQIGLPPTPTIQVTGVPPTAAPTDQSLLAVSLTGPFPVAVTGTATITFTPNTVAGTDDLTVGFAGGTRTLTFTIPPNQTAALFSQLPALSFGTTAGTITVTVTASINGQPITLPASMATQTIQVNRTAPFITSLQANRTSGGFSIVVNGFSTPREVTSARFQFQTSGAVQSSDITVQVGDAFKSFYNGASAAATGSQFTLTEPFTVSGSSAITGVSVTLTNSVGNSNTVTIRF